MRERLSHDLRTPLTAIKLAVDLCLRRWDQLDPAAIREYLGTVPEQVDRLELAIAEAEHDVSIEEEQDVVVLAEEYPDVRVVNSHELSAR